MTNHKGVMLNRKLLKPNELRKPDEYSVDGIYDESLRDRAFEPDIPSISTITTMIDLAIQEAIMFTYEPNGADQTITIDNTAAGIPWAAFPAGTTDVLVTSQLAGAYYTVDGSAPTSDANYLASGEERVWPIAMITAMKAIREAAVSAKWTGSPLKKVIP